MLQPGQLKLCQNRFDGLLMLKFSSSGGTFIAKIFRGKDVTLLYDQLRCYFARVTCAKPRSSRESSLEAFVVCEGFLSFFDAPSTTATATDGIQKSTAIRTLNRTTLELENDLKLISPFIACGDLSYVELLFLCCSFSFRTFDCCAE